MGKKPAWKRQHISLYAAGIMILLLCIGGCIEPEKRYQAKKSLDSLFETRGERGLAIARLLMSKGFFAEALEKNREVLKEYPESLGDRALMQIAALYAHPSNPAVSLQKSADTLERLAKIYPESDLKIEAETWTLVLRKIKSLDESYNIKVSELKHKLERWEAQTIEKNSKLKALNAEKRILQRRHNELTKKVEQLQLQLDRLKNVDIGIEEKKRQTLDEDKTN